MVLLEVNMLLEVNVRLEVKALLEVEASRNREHEVYVAHGPLLPDFKNKST